MAKLESVRAFVTVAKHGNLRDAGAELGRTQSALSMALGQLEQSLGGPLFETDRKRDLTDLGLFVRDAGSELIREHDRVMALIHGYAKGEAGHLRIASVPSVAALILPGLLGTFMDRHAGARVDLMDSDSTNVRRMIATGHADVGIAGRAPEGTNLLEEPLFEDQLNVVCQRGSMLARAQYPLTWHDLRDMSLIRNEALSVVDAPEAQAVIASSTLSVRNILSLFAMVAAGNGVTVLPGLATRSLDANTVAVPLTGPGSYRTVSLLSRDGLVRSPLSQAFHMQIREFLPEIIKTFGLAPI